jgi:hypothetical protein
MMKKKRETRFSPHNTSSRACKTSKSHTWQLSSIAEVTRGSVYPPLVRKLCSSRHLHLPSLSHSPHTLTPSHPHPRNHTILSLPPLSTHAFSTHHPNHFQPQPNHSLPRPTQCPYIAIHPNTLPNPTATPPAPAYLRSIRTCPTRPL